MSRLACVAVLAAALLGSMLLLLGASSVALAACEGPCTAEQLETGLVHPSAWDVKAHVHVEAATEADSPYIKQTPGLLEGLGEEGAGEEEHLLYRATEEGVQHSPHVYSIFWGSNIEETTEGKEDHAMLLKLFEGLTGSAWQGILTQYFDATGRISSTVTYTPYTDKTVKLRKKSPNSRSKKRLPRQSKRTNGL